MTWRAWGLTAITRRIMGCQSSRETRVHNAVDDVAGNMCQALDLGSNNCGDKGAKAAGEALRRCPGLRRLGLASNDIGAEGARLLAPAIRDHAALEELHLQGNRAGLGGSCTYACHIILARHVIGTHSRPSFPVLNGNL